MNPLSPLVQSILQNATSQTTSVLANNLKSNPGQTKGQLFDCFINQQYALKRFIMACMSRDPKVKFNSYLALNILVSVQGLIDKQSVNKQKLRQFIIENSAWKKNQLKKNQTEGFATGRLISFKALSQFFIKDTIAFQAISQILTQFKKYEEQVVQALFIITKDKKTQLKFKQLKLQSQSAILMRKILLKEQNILNFHNISKILQQLNKQYPKRSLTLQYIGLNLEVCLEKINPNQLFTKLAQVYFDEETELNFKGIYYLLILFENFIKSVTISKENLEQFLSIKMLTLWLEQLRVMNKKMKAEAKQIQIQFDLGDSEFCNNLLKTLHEEQVYLENVSNNHPLASLYNGVDPEKYYEYIKNLINKQNKNESQQIDQEKAQDQYYNQFQYFVRTRCSELTAQKLSESILILYNYYASNKKQASLNLIWSLLNSISIHKKKNKKNARVNIQKNLISILKGVNLQHLKAQEEFKKSFKKNLILLKKQIQSNQNSENSIERIFYNFNISVLMYSIIYQEEIQIAQELKMMTDDFLKLINQDIDKMSKPKKKVKKNKVMQEEQDEKKSIRVLIDLMIGLLTKAPQFLRNNIQTMFEALIHYIDQQDLKNILQVIGKPDQQYIEQL